jgi:metallo-beta-lactamase class B
MKWSLVLFAVLLGGPAIAQAGATSPAKCPSCAAWNALRAPFRVYGNTYYVGVAGLSAILITSDQGLILIDGDLPESPPQIALHIRALGFDPKKINLILNSHVHFDHAGGIAALQKLSGAEVAASPSTAAVMRKGGMGADDPQAAADLGIAAVARVRTVQDGETLHVGPLAVTAHFTPGHTSGGTSWSWQSCEQGRCMNLVYADSLTAVSSPGYRFSDHPAMLAGFAKSFATLNALPCDILLTPHPDFSGVFQRLKARDAGKADAFIDPNACRAYAASAREGLEKRLADEKAGK